MSGDEERPDTAEDRRERLSLSKAERVARPIGRGQIREGEEDPVTLTHNVRWTTRRPMVEVRQ